MVYQPIVTVRFCQKAETFKERGKCFKNCWQKLKTESTIQLSNLFLRPLDFGKSILLLSAFRLILYSRCVSIKKITFLQAIAGLLSNSRQLVCHFHALLHSVFNRHFHFN